MKRDGEAMEGTKQRQTWASRLISPSLSCIWWRIVSQRWRSCWRWWWERRNCLAIFSSAVSRPEYSISSSSIARFNRKDCWEYRSNSLVNSYRKINHNDQTMKISLLLFDDHLVEYISSMKSFLHHVFSSFPWTFPCFLFPLVWHVRSEKSVDGFDRFLSEEQQATAHAEMEWNSRTWKSFFRLFNLCKSISKFPINRSSRFISALLIFNCDRSLVPSVWHAASSLYL